MTSTNHLNSHAGTKTNKQSQLYMCTWPDYPINMNESAIMMVVLLKSSISDKPVIYMSLGSPMFRVHGDPQAKSICPVMYSVGMDTSMDRHNKVVTHISHYSLWSYRKLNTMWYYTYTSTCNHRNLVAQMFRNSLNMSPVSFTSCVFYNICSDSPKKTIRQVSINKCHIRLKAFLILFWSDHRMVKSQILIEWSYPKAYRALVLSSSFRNDRLCCAVHVNIGTFLA